MPQRSYLRRTCSRPISLPPCISILASSSHTPRATRKCLTISTHAMCRAKKQRGIRNIVCVEYMCIIISRNECAHSAKGIETAPLAGFYYASDAMRTPAPLLRCVVYFEGIRCTTFDRREA